MELKVENNQGVEEKKKPGKKGSVKCISQRIS